MEKKSMSDPITVEDYEKYGDEFFEKYDYVFKRMCTIMNPKSEDVLKVMESLGKLVMEKRGKENSIGPFGFNKNETPEPHVTDPAFDS